MIPDELTGATTSRGIGGARAVSLAPAVCTAPGPAKLTGRGLFSTEFCVNLLIARYALGLPFSRVIAMLSFQGLDVAPGTLAGVARRLNDLLAPLAAAITARNAAAGHAHADETSWRVFGQQAGDTDDHDALRPSWSSLQLTDQADFWHPTGSIVRR
jgi:hypothetical protein